MPRDLGWRQAVVGEAGSPTSSAAADQLLFGSGPNRCISLLCVCGGVCLVKLQATRTRDHGIGFFLECQHPPRWDPPVYEKSLVYLTGLRDQG